MGGCRPDKLPAGLRADYSDVGSGWPRMTNHARTLEGSGSQVKVQFCRKSPGRPISDARAGFRISSERVGGNQVLRLSDRCETDHKPSV